MLWEVLTLCIPPRSLEASEQAIDCTTTGSGLSFFLASLVSGSPIDKGSVIVERMVVDTALVEDKLG